MNTWLDSLEDCLDKNYLNQFDEIYYLSSKLVISVENLDQLAQENKLNSFLSKEDDESDKDLLDFFLLVNDDKQDIVAILSPFDLFTDEKLYTKLENITEDLSSVPTIEVVK